MTEICLASAGDDIKLWDGSGFTARRQFNPHSSNVSSIAWAHDNTALASTSTGGDKIVLTYTDNVSYEFAENDGRTCVAYNSTSRYIMGGGKDGTIQVWDLKSKKHKKSYENHKGRITSLQFNWNDTDIASGSESGEIILYNVVSGMASKPLIAPKTQAIQQISYSHFKKSLLGSVSDDGTVNLWDTNKRTLVHSFVESHKAPATGLAFSPLNEMLLLSCGLDKRITCYDVHGKKQVRTMMAESPLTSIDLMHDGATLAVGSTRGKIFVYDLRQGANPVRTMTAHTSSVKCLAFQHNRSNKYDNSGSARTGNRAASQTLSSSRKPLSSVNNNTSGNRDTEVANKPVNHKHMNGVASSGQTQQRPRRDMEGISDVAASNQINNNVESGVGDMFSPIRDTSSKNSTLETSSSSPALKHSSSLNRYADGVFSPLADEQSSGRHSAGSGVSPYLQTRVIPEGTVPEDTTPSRIRTSASQGALSHFSRSQDQLADQSLEAVKTRMAVHSPRQSHTMNTELSQSEPSIPQAAESRHSSRTPFRTSPPRDDGHRSSRRSPPVGILKTHSSLPEGSLPLSVIGESIPPEPQGREINSSGGDMGLNVTGFQMDVLRNLVEDAMDEFRDQVRKDVLNLHMEMIKMFQIQQAEMRAMLQQYSVNGELMEEIERLREENKRLKSKF